MQEENPSISVPAAKTLAFHEIEKNKEFTTRSYFPDLGAITETERSLKTTQKDDTNASTNHGPEIGNPNPEPFRDDDTYPVIIPNMQIKNYVARKLTAAFSDEEGFSFSEFGANKAFALKLRGEKQIMFLFNLLRKIGYPLRTNPRWNWVLGDEEAQSGFLVNPSDDNAKYSLDSGNKPIFRSLVMRKNPIDWKKITDILKEEKKSYEKSKDVLVKVIEAQLNHEFEHAKEHSNELLKSLETRMMNHIVKIRSRMKDFAVSESDESNTRRRIIKEVNDEISTLISEPLSVGDFTGFANAFYSFKLNEIIQNQMLLISELESAPSITYSWGSFLYVPKLYESDAEYIGLIKNLGINKMLPKDKEKIDKMLELSIETGALFEKWRKEQITKLKVGLSDGIKTFKELTNSDTQLAEFIQLISGNKVAIGEHTGKLLSEQSSTANSSQRAASSSQITQR